MIDTGGIEPDSRDVILSQMREQAEIAIATADVIIFLTDVRQGLQDSDSKVADMLRRSGKPVVLVVNKVDSFEKFMPDVYEFYNLGIGDPFPISAASMLGLGDMLDEVVKHFPDYAKDEEEDERPKVAIIGKPNVGKSSLINKLAQEDRVIVSDIAGTTRDVIEEYINLDGIPLMLIDTAGIRNTDDTVEKIGVEKSIKSIEKADLVVVMIDGSGFFGDEDVEVLHATKNKKRIVLINKTDLGQSKYVEAVKAKANGSVVIEVSAKTGMGLDILADEIRKVYNFGELAREDSAVITNMRHKTALIKASEALGRVVEAIDMNMPSDIASIDINIAIDALGEITGETVSDDIVTAIFHSFCVGK